MRIAIVALAAIIGLGSSLALASTHDMTGPPAAVVATDTSAAFDVAATVFQAPAVQPSYTNLQVQHMASAVKEVGAVGRDTAGETPARTILTGIAILAGSIMLCVAALSPPKWRPFGPS